MVIQSLRFQKMSFSYGPQEESLFEDVSFEIPRGKVLWLNGTAGSGTSTLIRILTGLQPVSQGRYFVNETDVYDCSFQEFLPFRLKIGYGMDEGGLLNNRTLKQNIELPASYHKCFSEEEQNEWVDFLLSKFQLKDFSHERPAMVRGSLRKATCIARAFSLKPQVLLLDHPENGLQGDLVDQLSGLIHLGLEEKWLKFVVVAAPEQSRLSSLFEGSLRVEAKKLIYEKEKVIEVAA